MANSIAGRVWNIDTPSDSPITSSRIRLRGVRWTGADTIGHTVVIRDGSGRVVWRSRAVVAGHVEADGIDRVYEGLAVSALDSGVLDLEVDFERA